MSDQQDDAEQTPAPLAFGTWLRLARQATGDNRAAFARRAGVSVAKLKYFESGRRQPTTRERQRLIAAVGPDRSGSAPPADEP